MKVRRIHSPGSCDYAGGYQELRWDLSGCNLRCSFCWSPASRPSETGDPTRIVSSREVVEETRRNLHAQSRAFIRFTGGEPTLQWLGITEVLAAYQAELRSPKPPILFQTNGIEIGKGAIGLDSLAAHRDQLYLFELSFKGTNPEEFSILSGKAQELYEFQLEGYQRLLDLSKKSRNICVVAVLGVYHSAVNGPSQYAFVHPGTNRLLFENPDNWDPRFRALWMSAPFSWVERLRRSPMGVWNNVWQRCGPNGARVLREFHPSASTNGRRLFKPKPAAAEYARRIVSKVFWH